MSASDMYCQSCRSGVRALRGPKMEASIPSAAQRAQRLSSETAVVTCRLFQRGPGWATRQERALVRAEDGGVRLRERNVLTRPNEPDVVVDRFFRRKEPEADAG